MLAEEKQRQYMISIIKSSIQELETQRNNLISYSNTISQAIKGSEQQTILSVISTVISEVNAAINTYYNVVNVLESYVFE